MGSVSQRGDRRRRCRCGPLKIFCCLPRLSCETGSIYRDFGTVRQSGGLYSGTVATLPYKEIGIDAVNDIRSSAGTNSYCIQKAFIVNYALKKCPELSVQLVHLLRVRWPLHIPCLVHLVHEWHEVVSLVREVSQKWLSTIVSLGVS